MPPNLLVSCISQRKHEAWERPVQELLKYPLSQALVMPGSSHPTIRSRRRLANSKTPGTRGKKVASKTS